MNGATAEPWVKNTSAPKSTRTSMMGPSHHFLRIRMKSQSSRTNDGCAGVGIAGSLRTSRPVVNPLAATRPWGHRACMNLSMPLEETMRTQRAIRRLKPDPVDDALVLHLIELALKAPTGSNAQSWEFVVIRDRAVKERIGRLNRAAWRLYGGL